jgi:hypothetical protein
MLSVVMGTLLSGWVLGLSGSVALICLKLVVGEFAH